MKKTIYFTWFFLWFSFFLIVFSQGNVQEDKMIIVVGRRVVNPRVISIEERCIAREEFPTNCERVYLENITLLKKIKDINRSIEIYGVPYGFLPELMITIKGIEYYNKAKLIPEAKTTSRHICEIIKEGKYEEIKSIKDRIIYIKCGSEEEILKLLRMLRI